jgi:hypothetical protein
VNATYDDYLFYPSLPLREFIFNGSSYSPVSICLPNTAQGINNGCKITIRIYIGNGNYTFIYGEPTTLLNRIYQLGDNSAINKMILNGYKSTNIIFNNGYWYEV